jgi:NADP-dependent 3-hydroxy acid dehydrogenase YdfG
VYSLEVPIALRERVDRRAAMELHSQKIRCTMISPGAIATELSESSSDEATRNNLREFMKMAIPAGAIARAIAYAIEQPADVGGR